jgi:hypothetical protein
MAWQIWSDMKYNNCIALKFQFTLPSLWTQIPIFITVLCVKAPKESCFVKESSDFYLSLTMLQRPLLTWIPLDFSGFLYWLHLLRHDRVENDNLLDTWPTLTGYVGKAIDWCTRFDVFMAVKV